MGLVGGSLDKQAEQGQRIANACFITGDSE
jgi:hypothetical protein